MATQLTSAGPISRVGFASETAAIGRAICGFAVPLTGGVLLGISFYAERWSWLAWLAGAPIAWAIYTPRAGAATYIGAFYGGLACCLLALEWIGFSYGARLFDSWLLVGHLLGICSVGVLWVARRNSKVAPMPAMILVPTLWVSMEWLRWKAAGVLFDDGFPVIQVGATQADLLPLVQIADLGGIPLLSWVVIAIGAALFEVVAALFAVELVGGRRPRRAVASATCAVLLIVGALAYGKWRLLTTTDEPGPTVGLVSGQFEMSDRAFGTQLKSAILARFDAPDVRAMAAEVRPEFPHMLVWQEGALKGESLASEVSKKGSEVTLASFTTDSMRLTALADDIGASLLVGCNRRSGEIRDEIYNSLLYVDRATHESRFYDKVHLAPSFEFRPALAEILGIFPRSTSSTARQRRFVAGADGQRSFTLSWDLKPCRFATMICYDVFFPLDHAERAGKNLRDESGSFFVAAANEHGAQDTALPRLTSAMQRFRAIEFRRSYARNAEYGISAIVDSRGRSVPCVWVDMGGEPKRRVLLGRVPIGDGDTIYGLLGDSLPMIATVFCGVLFVISFRRPADKTACRYGRRDVFRE